MSSAGQGGNPKRQPDLYWKNLQQLKTAAVFVRLYRNRLGRYVKGLEILRAFASSAAIGGWVIWRDYSLLWSSIIVAAQVADALKGVFPFAKIHRAASDLTIAMETICIDAEDEWESIYRGPCPKTPSGSAGPSSGSCSSTRSESIFRMASSPAGR